LGIKDWKEADSCDCAMVSISLLYAAVLAAYSVHAVGVRPGQIKNLVTFGDSYTDIVITGASASTCILYLYNEY
jgi:hypothetical protein